MNKEFKVSIAGGISGLLLVLVLGAGNGPYPNPGGGGSGTGTPLGAGSNTVVRTVSGTNYVDVPNPVTLSGVTATGIFTGDGSGLTNQSIGIVQPTNTYNQILQSSNTMALAGNIAMTNAYGMDTNTSMLQLIGTLAGTTGGTTNNFVLLPRSVNGDMITVRSNRLAPLTISTGGSPLNYTNTTGRSQFVFVNGGTVSSISINGTSIFTIAAPNSTIPLQTNEWATITFTIAPAVFTKPY